MKIVEQIKDFLKSVGKLIIIRPKCYNNQHSIPIDVWNELSVEQKSRIYDYNYEQNSLFMGFMVIIFTIAIVFFIL